MYDKQDASATHADDILFSTDYTFSFQRSLFNRQNILIIVGKYLAPKFKCFLHKFLNHTVLPPFLFTVAL